MTPAAAPNVAQPAKPRKELSPRVVLLLHVIAFGAGLKVAYVLNRSWMPEHAWARWLAIAWGVVLGIHVLYAGVLELLSMGGHNPT
jgi:hypothetical protein